MARVEKLPKDYLEAVRRSARARRISPELVKEIQSLKQGDRLKLRELTEAPDYTAVSLAQVVKRCRGVLSNIRNTDGLPYELRAVSYPVFVKEQTYEQIKSVNANAQEIIDKRNIKTLILRAKKVGIAKVILNPAIPQGFYVVRIS